MAYKVVEQMFSLGLRRAKDEAPSLKHHIASLFDTVEKRNSKLNKNEADLDEHNNKLDKKTAELH